MNFKALIEIRFRLNVNKEPMDNRILHLSVQDFKAIYKAQYVWSATEEQYIEYPDTYRCCGFSMYKDESLTPNRWRVTIGQVVVLQS